MDLAHLAALLINGAHFAGDHEADRRRRLPGRPLEVQRQSQIRFEGVHPRRRRLEFGGQFRQPLGVGAIAGAHHLHPLVAAPEIQVLQVGVPGGGDGEVGMDMQVGDDFHLGIDLITKPGEPLISGFISLNLIDHGTGRIVTGVHA